MIIVGKVLKTGSQQGKNIHNSAKNVFAFT